MDESDNKIITEPQSDTFHLGLTMAGAVSAGCYTAGVLDYLFEILDLWEKAKKKELPEFEAYYDVVPKHNVIIDVMGGASAGGMCSTMAAMHILNGQRLAVNKVPVNPSIPTGNILYDSWVIMEDYDFEKKSKIPNKTFKGLWELNDLKNNTVKSFLNSSFIERLAKRAFENSNGLKISEQVKKLPDYFSKNMQILLSHCIIEGLPLRVDFETKIAQTGRKSIIPNHTTYEHYMVSHYHLNNGKKPDDNCYLDFNPYDQIKNKSIINATIATGSFPFGLNFKEFSNSDFNVKYLENVFKRIITGDFGNPSPTLQKNVKLKSFPKKVSSVTVDGGSINNEPYREVMSILRSQSPTHGESSMPNHGMVMIDPFPNRANEKDVVDEVDDLLKKMVSTLLNQSRVKRREMLETDDDSYFRSIIFPRKWKSVGVGKVKPETNPLDCGSLGGFSGLFDINFRVHDFFLGRNNARNFFRYWFSMPYDKDSGIVHPIHQGWTVNMVSEFKIEKDGKCYLPIIPDLYLLKEDQEERIAKWSAYDIPKNNIFNPKLLFDERPRIRERVFKILNLVSQKSSSSSKKNPQKNGAPTPKTFALMDKNSDQGFISKSVSFIINPLFNFGLFIAKRPLSKKITNFIIYKILSDMEKTGKL